MAASPAPQPMSVEDYLRLDRASTDVRYEYYDGRVRMMAGGSINHSAIAANLIGSLSAPLRGTGCRSFTSDARVQIAVARYVYPDVTISCDREDWGTGDILHAPRVVFEVLSPSTEIFDRNQKSDFYRACPSIQEFVLVSSDRPHVELFRRAEPFWQFAAYGMGETLTLASIGVSLPIAELYRDIDFPPPPPDELAGNA